MTELQAAPQRWMSIGVTGRAGALVLCVALCVAVTGAKLAVAATLAWLLAAALHPSGFRVLRRPSLWAILGVLVVPILVFSVPRDVGLPWGLAASREGLTLAFTVLVRSLVIVVAAAGFGATVSVRDLTTLFEAVGLRGLGFALGVAVHTLPLAQQTWTTSARALRLRGGFRRAPARDAGLLGMTVIGNALRHADEVVEAAMARGFAPDARRRVAPARWQSDLAWLAAGAAVAATILLW